MDELERLLVRQTVEAQAPPPKCVLFIDMLGFSSLTEEHPEPIVWDFDSDEISSTTSLSAERLGRFQHVLNMIPHQDDVLRPSHLMLFSDCAFVVFDNALQTAVAAAFIMRMFFHQAVPVRMGLAHGTWNVDRFSFDSFGSLTLTRAVFYGTGVVRATEAEKRGGKGCRIFLHPSIDAQALARERDDVMILEAPERSSFGPNELNYLNPYPGLTELAEDKDVLFVRGYKNMISTLRAPVAVDVERHYTDTRAALNRMRAQLNRDKLFE
jgi:hypothetical protein